MERIANNESAHRYFFALRPEATGAEQVDRVMRRLRRERALRGWPVPRWRRHVSLASLGLHPRLEPDRVARAVRAAAGVAPPRFVVAFNRIAAFGDRGGRRTLVLRGDEGVLGVDLLQAALHGALAQAGLAPPRTRPFEAHLTLFRGEDEVAEAVIAPVAWPVSEFVLIHSLVGQGRYETVGRWRLPGNRAEGVTQNSCKILI